MKISIITATYNSAASIRSAMQSVSSQTYPDIEYIVVDGGSTDETVSIVKNNYPGELKITSEKDLGIYDALNKGIRRATGDAIGFVHSDDLFASPHIISEVAAVFGEKAVDGVYGDLQYVSKEDTSKIIRYWKSKPYTGSLLSKGWMPAHPTLFLKKEVYAKHGFFNLDYKIAADYDLMLRIFRDKALKFHYLPRVITKMRVGGASNKSLRNIVKKSSEDLRALQTNRIKSPVKVLVRKNLSKLSQFIKK